MPVDPTKLEIGDVVQVDPGVDPLFSGVFLVVCEIMPYGIKGYYPVPAPMDPDEENPTAMVGHYETTFKAVSYVGRPGFTVHSEIFQCPFCRHAYSIQEVKVCRICEARHCKECPHAVHGKIVERERHEARVRDATKSSEDTKESGESPNPG